MKKLIEVRDLHISFTTHSGLVRAIRGVDFDLHEGETLAIVGESGSGKSVTTKALMGILAKNGVVEKGTAKYMDRDILTMNRKETTALRGKEIAMIFQDPMTSLNPTMTVGYQIREAVIEHNDVSKKEAKARAIELLDLVGIPNPNQRYKQYPHQLSGGMRQRVVIAIALACNPKVLIADEPTTALDVTIQAQIIELIKELQQKINLAIIFITHDLGVVANVADRVAVMYAGRIVEVGSSDEVFYEPVHPYTWGLLASVPDMSSSGVDLYSIPGAPPNLMYPPKGDAFALRSEFALKIDFEEAPPMFKVSDTHYASTWLLHKNAPEVHMPEVLKERIHQMLKEVALYG